METRYTWGFALRVVVKAAALFALANLLFALSTPLPALGSISVYNALAPGRARLPHGATADAYTLTLDSLDAMFASHVVSAPDQGAFHVFVIGDSSTWGIQLAPDQTASALLNAADLSAEGRPVRAYNLGYPTMSVMKDLLLLDHAARYRPDAIIWLITLESLARRDQLSAPLVARNPAATRDLIARYALDYDADALALPSFWDRTLIGSRRALADWWRLQAYAFMWGATGIDHLIGDYTPRSNDLDADLTWKGFAPDALAPADLAFDVLAAGHMAVDVPLLLVNEPIFVADGANSDLRYNAWYPRWAYDAYRGWLAAAAAENGWRLLDLWDAVPPHAFTDSPVHRDPAGEQQIAAALALAINAEWASPQ